MGGVVSYDGADDLGLQARGVLLAQPAPLFPQLACVLHVGGFCRAAAMRVGTCAFKGASFLPRLAEQRLDELALPFVQARVQARALLRGHDGLQHGLHRAASAPLVYLRREGGVDDRLGHDERLDVGAVEQYAADLRAPVGELAREVVLPRAHGPALVEQHVVGEQHGLGVLLAERREPVQRLDVGDGEVVQVDGRVHFAHGLELRLGKRVHVEA